MGRFARKYRKVKRRSTMRVVTLTPRQFNNFLWPAFRSSEVKGHDIETLVRLKRRLSRASIEQEISKELQELIDAGQPVYLDRRIEDTTVFYLDSDEHRMLVSLFGSQLENFSIMAIEEAYEVQSLLKDAEEYDPQEAVLPAPDAAPQE